MANDIQQPDEAPGPAAALVVVHHVNGVIAVAEFAEQFFQVGTCRQQAGGRRLAKLSALGVDEAGAGNVPAAITVGTGQIDQDQLWRIQARQQVSRFDHQRQAGKVSHPQSPGWNVRGRL
ncbi:hypothetical protein D3C76_1090180 [compost metagenome]